MSNMGNSMHRERCDWALESRAWENCQCEKHRARLGLGLGLRRLATGRLQPSLWTSTALSGSDAPPTKRTEERADPHLGRPASQDQECWK